jgi:hypothetical protein
MPVVLGHQAWPEWLGEEPADSFRLKARLAPYPATALFAATGSGYAVALYILFCTIVSVSATAFLPDYTNLDISQEHGTSDLLGRAAEG